MNVLWYSFTETTDEQCGCFVAVGSGRVFKKGILFPLSDNDITTWNNNDIIHLKDTCYSRILNSINPQTTTHVAVAEFVESENQEQNDQLQPESLLKASMSNILTLKQLTFEAAEKEALEKGEMRTWCTTDMTKKVTKVGGYLITLISSQQLSCVC